MVFTIPWDESSPPGSTPADTIDTEIQNDKTAVRERITDLFPGWADDLEDPKIAHAWLLRKTDFVNLADATLDNVDWTTEDRDTGPFITVPSDTITIPAGLGGLYFLDLAIGWGVSAAGRRDIEIRVNGVTVALERQNFVTGSTMYSHVSKVLVLAAADAIIIRVFQTSGGALDYGNVDVNPNLNYFSGIKIGG